MNKRDNLVAAPEAASVGPHTSASRMEALRNVIRVLRSPAGCPWDREQTVASLKKSLLEEAFEAADAIDHEDDPHIKEELGDVLLILLLMSQIEEDSGVFSFEDVMSSLYDKLIRRHPHVFGEESAGSSDDVKARWKQIKRDVEGRVVTESVLSAVPVNMSPLLRAQKLQKKAAQSGFDWNSVDGPLDKIAEEIQELTEELQNAEIDTERVSDELGDVLFSVVNLSRHIGISADDALRKANRKFHRRFVYVERHMSDAGMEMKPDNLDTMESFWASAKKRSDV